MVINIAYWIWLNENIYHSNLNPYPCFYFLSINTHCSVEGHAVHKIFIHRIIFEMHFKDLLWGKHKADHLMRTPPWLKAPSIHDTVSILKTCGDTAPGVSKVYFTQKWHHKAPPRKGPSPTVSHTPKDVLGLSASVIQRLGRQLVFSGVVS